MQLVLEIIMLFLEGLNCRRFCGQTADFYLRRNIFQSTALWPFRDLIVTSASPPITCVFLNLPEERN